jgi:hypothetical protein
LLSVRYWSSRLIISSLYYQRTPKDGYLVVQFPILPTTNAELKDQMLREVIPHNQQHPRDGSYNFTKSLRDVPWRVATEADFEESGLPEEALEMFSMKQVILASFRTSDPKVFGFKRSSQIIGIRTKLYLDWETNGKCGDTNSCTELNKFITELAD